jgi:predicted nucleic acid-binding Zn ribbon protein
MADLCGLTDGFAEFTLECALSHLRAVPSLPDSHGKCLNACGEQIARDQHFCCAECRDDFERIQAAKRRNGTR